MPKVYVVNDTGQDYSKAAEFGELVFLTRGKIDPFRPHAVQEEIARTIASFNAKEDYLLPCGAVLANGFAFSWLAAWFASDEEEEVKVNLLLFDAKKLDYIARTVAL